MPKNCFYVCFFCSGHSLWGRKKHINKIPPKIPGQSREHFVYVFFFLYLFFFSLPTVDTSGQSPRIIGKFTVDVLEHVFLKAHWKIQGRFPKRAALANVPSFRFSFRGNLRIYPRSGFCSGGKHLNVPSFRFSFPMNIRQNFFF